MHDKLKIKVVEEHKLKEVADALQKGYFEVACEPTCPGDSILLCNKPELSFDDTVNIILSIKTGKYMLLAMSFLYWRYIEDFCRFYETADEGRRRRLGRRVKAYFKRWYRLSLRSDASLYPQNSLIVEFVKKHMPGLID